MPDKDYLRATNSDYKRGYDAGYNSATKHYVLLVFVIALINLVF